VIEDGTSDRSGEFPQRGVARLGDGDEMLREIFPAARCLERLRRD
jgi:hypothetical protein